MATSKSNIAFSLIFFSILTATVAHSPIQEILKAHNDARAELGLNPLKWSLPLQAYATAYSLKRKLDCKLEHSHGRYGENLFWGSPYGYYNYTDAVNDWVSEKQYYDYNSNTCQPDQMCGHYTQVVWAKTERVGCAEVKCSNGDQFVACNYDPPGNWDGEKPY
jgi:pathogenesis-related protein 1